MCHIVMSMMKHMKNDCWWSLKVADEWTSLVLVTEHTFCTETIVNITDWRGDCDEYPSTLWPIWADWVKPWYILYNVKSILRVYERSLFLSYLLYFVQVVRVYERSLFLSYLLYFVQVVRVYERSLFLSYLLYFVQVVCIKPVNRSPCK